MAAFSQSIDSGLGAPLRRRRALRWWPRAILVIFAMLAGTCSVQGPELFGSAIPTATAEGGQVARTAMPFALPQGLRPISPAEAIAINQAIRPDMSAGPAAASFMLPPRQAEDYRRALNCLAMAVYYEAASESLDGQRAVAQVVLNRVHHPAFPNSVCGVVFQGSERNTGCQFSFACDGSRARAPSAQGWARALSVASAALSGQVFPGVGLATHYHADYVLPYWASTLTESAQLGRHIFYRWPGGLGTPAAFHQDWSGREPGVPAFRPAAPLQQTLLTPLLAAQAGDGVADVPPVPQTPAPPPSRLRADEHSTGLIVDEARGELLAH